jgi:DNA-binding GntR family transcriptional regulator
MDGQALEARNLPDQLADQLAIMIATGELKPGQRIFEKKICEMKGVSRIPVREALRLLQAQGVVRTEPNRGTYVTGFTEELHEMAELRLAVERIALRRIIERKTPKALIASQLSVAIEAMRRAVEIGDRLALCQADLWFHDRIIDLAASPMLEATWRLLARGVLVFMMREHGESSHPLSLWIAEHEELLAILESDSSPVLDEHIEQHIFSGVRAPRPRFESAIPAVS